jgi:hypothetical protein
MAASPAATTAHACGRRPLQPLLLPPLLLGQVPPRALVCGRRPLLLPLQGRVGRACQLCAPHQHRTRMQQQPPWQQQLQAPRLLPRVATPPTTACGRLPLLRLQGTPLTLLLPLPLETAQLHQLTSSSSMAAQALA